MKPGDLIAINHDQDWYVFPEATYPHLGGLIFKTVKKHSILECISHNEWWIPAGKVFVRVYLSSSEYIVCHGKL